MNGDPIWVKPKPYAMKATHPSLNDEGEANWPLHAKRLLRVINMTRFEKLLRPDETRVWKALYALLTPSAEYLKATIPDSFRPRRLRPTDASALVNAGLARPTTAPITMSAFPVAEPWKHRRRCIHHPRWWNDCLDVPRIQLPSLKEIKTFMAQGHECLWTADFTSFYYQFDISAVCERFVFGDTNGCNYALLRMPMGLSVSCAIAQFVARIVTMRAAEQHGIAHSLTYIDNVLFGGTRQQLAAVRTSFRAICDDLGLTIGDTSEVSDIVDFIGFTLNAKQRSVACSAKMIEKLRSLDPASVTSVRDLLRLFGVVFSAARTRPTALSSFFWGLKLYRRVCGQVQSGEKHLGSKATFWSSLRPSFERLRSTLLVNQPLVVSEGVTTFLATDASALGWGLSVFADGNHYTRGGAWDTDTLPLHINVKELLAVKRGLHALDEMGIDHLSTEICVDSTVAFSALRRGYSPSVDVNRVLTDIATTFPSAAGLRLTWVPSASNPADPPSRGQDLTEVSRLWNDLLSAF